MTCQRCGTTMIRTAEGHLYCYPCEQNAPRPNLGPRETVPSGDVYGERLRKLEDRLAKLENFVADERRRRTPPRPRFLGETAEEPRPGEPDETRTS